MIRTFLLLFFLLSALHSFAQNPLFTQYQLAPVNTNPAWAAASPDWWVVAHYRRQNFDGGYIFQSSQLTVTRPLLQGKRRYGGVGISVLDDNTGESGWYRFQRLGALLAHDISLSRYQRLSLGVQAHYQIKRISTENIRTGSQFRPGQGFDPALGSGENMNDLQANYLSLGTGVLWYALDRHENTTFYAGISWLDLNRPDESFFGDAQPLPSTLSLQSGLRAYQKNRFTLFPELLLLHQAGVSILNVGSRFSYELRNAFGIADSAPRVDFIPRYTLNRSLALALQWHQSNYTLGVSFDTGASSHRANPLRSAFEVALAWHQPVTPKNKNKRKRRKKRKSSRRNRSTEKISVAIPLLTSLPPASFTDSVREFSVTRVVVPLSSNDFRGRIETSTLNLFIEFPFGQTSVGEESRSSLQAIARFLRQNSNLIVTLTGHTDNVGSREGNQRLSLARANAVRQFLLNYQIDYQRIKVGGRGEEEPLYPNADEVLRAKNRRVEISFSH
ncbi:PorP/SprF family type IX secretion system membrane protein [Tunicatimonas pelagia]|uniref:PorP/SprF family type IX secretion system membrane protein n=1 Tax=Tunicatimonas pelagia TaxID=931531 RepID=UPI002666C91F|nr:PorP/SprF family type IX secretion system membrane protein [Tunicatimonas pelagia]WKN41076.1 PorP/SprF family type IX secretion system membrane protein [Tunicatimonas pelagia]